jgi:hypothetical protein
MSRQHRHTELQALTTDRIAAAVRRADGNVSQAARALGCTFHLINRRAKNDAALAALITQVRQHKTK